MRVGKRQLLIFQLIYTIFAYQWLSLFEIFRGTIFVADVINILLMLLLYKDGIENSVKCINKLWKCIEVILIFSVLLSCIQLIDNKLKGIVLMLWSVRMFFRPFLIMICIESTFCLDDFKNMEQWILRLNTVNVFASVIQFYFLGIQWDTNGGIFGIRQGCNAYTNVFYCLACAYMLICYIDKSVNVRKVIYIFASAVLVGYWAELKFLYYELIIIILASVIMTGNSYKKIGIVVIVAFLLWWSIPRAVQFLPSNFQVMFEFEGLLEYNDMAYNEADFGMVSRGNAFEIISENIFQGNLLQKIIGVGLGGANSIRVIGLESAKYILYGWMHYDFFSFAYLFVELGYAGLAGFIIIFMFIIRCYLKLSLQNELYKKVGILGAIIAIMNFWYNSTWTTDGTAYMLMLFLSIPLIALKSEQGEKSYA